MTPDLCSRAARAMLAGSIVLSLGLSPAYGYMLARPGGGFGHAAMRAFHGPLGAQHGGPAGHASMRAFPGPLGTQQGWTWRGSGLRNWGDSRGFAESDRGRISQDGWGRDAWGERDDHGWIGRGHYAWSSRGRDGRGGWGGSPWLLGSGYWGGYSEPNEISPGPVIIADGGAPLPAGRVYPGASTGPSEHQGGCVVHELNYDAAGNYVGDKETPYC